jgi:hypothetical protein
MPGVVTIVLLLPKPERRKKKRGEPVASGRLDWIGLNLDFCFA